MKQMSQTRVRFFYFLNYEKFMCFLYMQTFYNLKLYYYSRQVNFT